MRFGSWILVVVLVSGILLFGFGCVEPARSVLPEPAAAVSPDAELPVAQIAPEPNELGPKITFDEVVHDFGIVSPRSKNPCEFKFTNTGKGILKVNKKIKSSCGCTVPQLKKDVYESGESGIINVVYTAGRKGGAVSRRLYVSSNDGANPKVMLSVNAKVVESVKYEPQKLRFSLKGEDANYPDITLKSLDGKAFGINGIKSTADSITVDYDGSARAKKFVLKPKVNLKKLERATRGNVKIYLTHPGCDMVVIPYEVVVEFSVTPAMISILGAKPGESIQRELWILNNYGEDFEIESASSKKGIVKILNQEKVEGRYKFNLEITPPVSEGRGRVFTDVFVVKIKGGKKIEVNCRGFYAKR